MRRSPLWLAGICLVTLFVAVDCSTEYRTGINEACKNNQIDTDSGESDVDCGGKNCEPCSEGSRCNQSADCSEGLLCSDDGLCVWAHCTDKIKNADETDRDCGGSCLITCGAGKGCLADKDCESIVCKNQKCASASCTDGVKNQGESAVDCGDLSGVCDRCVAGKACADDDSCESGICKNGSCASSGCTDKTRNGSESDVDCGGDCPARCATGKSCTDMTDCATGVCTKAVCAPAACNDSVKNGSETGVDCGGNCDAKCAVGQGCTTNSDCTINSCSQGVCADPSCSNNTLDGTETALDCGGANCPACADDLACAHNEDCISLHCVNKTCVPAGCSDQILNGIETGVDCGGDCTHKCDVDQGCARNLDCLSGKCSAGKCQVPTCTDAVQNDLETDIDCGGSVCTGAGRTCDNGRKCRDDGDCRSGVCNAGTGVCQAQSCTDTRMNQTETDIDCGGTCDACPAGKKCKSGSDCVNGICDTDTTGRCLSPKCDDKVKNGLEGDTDCGAICVSTEGGVLCPVGATCNNHADCSEGVCGPTGKCLKPSCTDGVENGAELDLDCLDPVACPTKKCLPGQTCRTVADCDLTVSAQTTCPAAGVCTLPGCGDKIVNGSETDLDCGGGGCPACGVGQKCASDTDCNPITSGYCTVVGTGKVCVAATCSDGRTNGAETAEDCGGSNPACARCAPALACSTGSDCQSDVCTGNLCQPPTCTDNRQNGTETDLNCGGGACPGCGDGLKCNSDADCLNSWCTPEKICAKPTCSDLIKNGLETDVDCGGTVCTTKCGDGTHGTACKTDSDCAKGWCKEWLGTCSLIADEWKWSCMHSSPTVPCQLAPVGGACDSDRDCQSLTCGSDGKCAVADNCPGQLLTDADGVIGTTPICTGNNPTDKANCLAYLRCFGTSPTCNPASVCFTTPDGKCGQNTIGGGTAVAAAALSAWTAAGCTDPTKPMP